MEKYCFLFDNQNIEDLITPFVSNMVFQHIGLFWIIQSNKNLSLDIQNIYPSWILNGSCYNTTIFLRYHLLVFEDYFTTSKHDKYYLICSIKAHEITRNQATRKNLLMTRKVVVVSDHFNLIQQKNHLKQLINT